MIHPLRLLSCSLVSHLKYVSCVTAITNASTFIRLSQHGEHLGSDKHQTDDDNDYSNTNNADNDEDDDDDNDTDISVRKAGSSIGLITIFNKSRYSH